MPSKLVASARGYLLTGASEDLAQLKEHDDQLDKALEALRARNRRSCHPEIAIVEKTATAYAAVVSQVKEREAGDGVVTVSTRRSPPSAPHCRRPSTI